MSKSLSSLRQAVGRLMGSGSPAMITGTPNATFSTTGFQCSALALEEDSYFNDWYIRFYSGTHKDQTRRITGFTQSGGVVVFSPALTGAVDATDLFELHRDFSPDEINTAINLSISMVEEEALQDVTDETLTIVADTFEYALPSSLYSLDAVYQCSDGEFTRIDSRFWQIINKSGTKYLWFDKNKITLNEDYTLRLIGQSIAGQLTLDASTTDIAPAYLIQQAKALLHQQRIDGTDGVSERHDKQMTLAQAMSDRERSKVFVTPRGWKV